MAETLFSIVLTGRKPPEKELLTALFQSIRGAAWDEAVSFVRHARGFIGENLTAADSERIVKECRRLSLAVAVLPQAALPAPPVPLRLTKAACDAGEFSYTVKNSALERTSFDEISILAATPVKEETKTTIIEKTEPSAAQRALGLAMLAAGLPIGIGKAKETKREITRTELKLYLDIFLKSSACRLRIDSDDFDFSSLGAQKTYSSQTNFRLLAREIAQKSQKALINRGLEALLKGEPLAPLGYDTLKDLEQEERWLSFIAAAPEPPTPGF